MNDNILYEALGISRNASNQQINQAYLKSVQENQNNPEKIELINISYQVLSNPRMRQIYDCKGIEGLNDIEANDVNENQNDAEKKEKEPEVNHDFYQKEKNEEKAIDNLLYDTLKIRRDATLVDIQNAYEREYILITSSVDSLMNVNLQKIQLLNAAYNVLTNPEIRKVYDKSGIAGVNQMQEKNQENEKNQKKFADNLLYEILGVNRFADENEIQEAYLNLLKNADYSNKEKIKMIHSAYSVLSVPKIRKVYDDEGIEGINKNFTTIQFDEIYFSKKNEIENSNKNENENENENYENLLYDTLGIEREASITQIRFAYQNKLKELNKKYGFINDESEEVQLIKASFNVLSNPKLRSVYDKSGIAGINQLQSEENNEKSNENQNQNNSKDSIKTNENQKDMNCNSNIDNKNDSNCGDNILYDALGAKRSSSFIEIQMSFLHKLNETVNDDDSEKSQLLHAAYNVLSDPELRKIYDNGGIGAINKVYEERAKMHQKQEIEKSIQKDEVFVTQSTSTKAILEECDSYSENSDDEMKRDPFHLFDDGYLKANLFSLSDSDDDNENESENGNENKNQSENENENKSENENKNKSENENENKNKSENKSEDENKNENEDKNDEIFNNLELTLEQLYNGCTISKTVQVEISCPHCKGTGNEYAIPFPKCPVCNGTGQKIELIEKPADFLTSNLSNSGNQKKKFSMKRICEKCLGRGELRTDYSMCCVCYGLKKFKSDFHVEFQIKPGTSDGEIIKVPLKTENEVTDIKFVFFKIFQKKHDLFEKLGNDLIYIKKINLSQSLCGNLCFPIETLDKRKIIVKGEKNVVIQPNSSFVIKNEGFPIKNDDFSMKKGDLIIKFVIDLPSVFSLGPKVVNLLKNIQPLKDADIPYDRSKILKEKLYFCQLPYESVS